MLAEPVIPRKAALFHALNQRLPASRPRRTVTTFHDLFVLTGDYSTPEFRRRFAEQARQAAAESDLIIAVSAFTASQIEQLLGVEQSRIRVVHHGVRAPLQNPVPREKIILHVGAIQKRKNVARLIEAFEALPGDWRLALAGSCGFGAEEILGKIRSSRVLTPGYVTAAELADWYARSMILAFPSLDEGFGIPVLEAMAAGVPVITSNRSATREIAGNAAMLIDPESVEEIKLALQTLTADEQLRQDLASRGRIRAAEFTWSRALESTWNVYGELLGN
jgi:glycosyltransferase involved in cell wall biosynthesis